MSLTLWNKLESANSASEYGPPAVHVGTNDYNTGWFGNGFYLTDENSYVKFNLTSHAVDQFRNGAIGFWWEKNASTQTAGGVYDFFTFWKDSNNYLSFGIVLYATYQTFLISGRKDGTYFSFSANLHDFVWILGARHIGLRMVNGKWFLYVDNLYIGSFGGTTFPVVPKDIATFLDGALDGDIEFRLGFANTAYNWAPLTHDHPAFGIYDNVTLWNTAPSDFTGYDTEDGFDTGNDTVLWSLCESNSEASQIGPVATDTGAVTFPAGNFNNGLFTGATGIYRSFPGTSFTPNNWTFRSWIKLVDTGVANLLFRWSYDANNYIKITLSGNTTIAVKCVVGGVTVTHTLTIAALSTATCYHLAVVFDRGGIDGGANIVRVYIDGSMEDSSDTAVGNQANTGGTIYVGGEP